MNIAISAQSLPLPSETFINVHKNGIKGNIHFLYGGQTPYHSENNGNLLNELSFSEKIFYKIKQNIYNEKELLIKKAIKKYLLKHKIKILVSEFGVTGAKLSPILKELGIPQIVNFFGYDAFHSDTLNSFRDSYGEMFDYATYITAVSKDMIEQLKRLGADPKKLVYNPCGVEKQFLEMEANLQSKRFIAIGRFVDKKAPYFTLAAFKKAYEKDKSIRLVFAGEGYLWESVQNMAEYWGLSK